MRRLSPLSVPYRIAERGGQLLAAVVVISVTGMGEPIGGPWLSAALGIGGAAAAAVMAYEVAYYRRFGYELTGETLDIESGVLARRDREIPLSRIQNLDVSRNAVQRLLGVAAVRVETAGGSETEATLRFVDTPEAARLRREVARLKRDGPETDREPPEPLFELAGRELALLGALSFDARLPGAALVLVPGAIPTLLPRGAGVATLALLALGVVTAAALLSWIGGAAVAVLNYYGFALRRVDEGLEYERGLLRRYDGTVPLEKLQTLVVADDPLKRRFGYASLVVRTAGYAPGGSARESEVAVPIATRDRIEALVESIEGVDLGEVAFERPPKRVRRRYAARYAIGVAAFGGLLWVAASVTGRPVPWYVPAPLLALVPVAAHLKWRHRGYWLGGTHAVTRNGVLRRSTTVVPYYRVQTVIETRGPLQRRWRLSTVAIDTAGSFGVGERGAAAVDVDREAGARLREAVAGRLRAALARRQRSDDAGGSAG